MSIKYIFRLDDICPDMNYKNFSRIRDIFIKNNIKPIIGVIPHNEDQKLINQAGQNAIDANSFWKEIKTLQQEHGWSVALHGYNHVYTTGDAGILKINKRSEFAGLSFEEQNKKIRLGKEIFEKNEIEIDAFMAPAHSFDWITVDALKKNGINTITDGKNYWPYYKKEVLFIPHVHSWPAKYGFGIHTVGLHINEWSDDRFEEFDKMVSNIKSKAVTLNSVASDSERWNNVYYLIVRCVSSFAISSNMIIRNIVNDNPKLKVFLKKIIR